MTIRYECAQCSAVLKIRDELAGTSAKCPKCKAEFLIPSAGKPGKKVSKAALKSPKEELMPAGALPKMPMVDMPTEVTPKVDPADTDLLEIARAAAADAATAATRAAEAPKPSIAELMREHEATRKKKKGGSSPKEKSDAASSSSLAAMVTSGSAADVLTRNYDQKRGQAAEPAPMTREERRAAEQKEALRAFVLKMWPVALGVLVGAYFLFSYLMSEPLPDLGYPSGVVTQNGQPMANVLVEFIPIESTSQLDGKAVNTVSSGYTDQNGYYEIMFDAEQGISGAVVGKHRIKITSIDGIGFNIPPDQSTQVVEDGASPEINFTL
ncbi:MAG: hypothetical protein NXI04_11210 [Planctomycetaceae bacterium]|nr:hypothetical protein [Planctomycetaceae bacterium]